MSKVDPEVLYLILSKVAAKESFYTYVPSQLPPTQKAGTITRRQLGEAYERITGSRIDARYNWNLPLSQLNSLLAKCGLPALGDVVAMDDAVDPAPAILATRWPAFGALKNLYRKS